MGPCTGPSRLRRAVLTAYINNHTLFGIESTDTKEASRLDTVLVLMFLVLSLALPLFAG